MTSQQQARDFAKRIVKLYFKDDYGNPFEMTDGQADIFNLIFTKKYNRNEVITYTQYGKSDTISMATIMRVTTFNEPFAVIAGNMEKSMIIMSRIIQHLFDHERFYSMLELDEGVKLDRLRRERSKEHLTFRGGGRIRAFTANAKNRQAVREALTGFGSPNIIEDEAPLIPDDLQSMIMRMLGGHRSNFLLKIGNPFYLNHFYRSWNNSKYHKVFINYEQGIREGRISPEFIEEMRSEPFFDVLYECKFPDRNEFIKGGYRALIDEDLLKNAFITWDEAVKLKLNEGRTKLGADFAGGGNDKSAYVIRWPKLMRLVNINKASDTMQQVNLVRSIAKEYEVQPLDISVDYGGLGQGIGDRLDELDLQVNKVRFGQSAPEKDKYKNVRAYMYYEFKKWLKAGGRIVHDDGFLELLSVNYKSDSEAKFMIQPKEELKKHMVELGFKPHSPDVADAAALTFADNSALLDQDDFEFI